VTTTAEFVVNGLQRTMDHLNNQVGNQVQECCIGVLSCAVQAPYIDAYPSAVFASSSIDYLVRKSAAEPSSLSRRHRDRALKSNDIDKSRGGLSRRGFLGGVGAGIVGTGIASVISSAQTVPTKDVQVPRTSLVINGTKHEVSVEARDTLLSVLREKLGMTGTKVGCERGECGACTVLIDGIPRYSCLTLALEVQDKEITTIEGLLNDGKLSVVQQAFVECDAFQCGYCTPGQIMAAEGLLRKNPSPDIEEIREGMSGNLCRCGAYQHIFKAIHRAADLRRS